MRTLPPTCCHNRCAWIFSELPREALADFCSLSKPMTYAQGDLIFREGEPVFGMYVICAGTVKLAKHSTQGKTQILKLLGPCELLGEEMMFDRNVYVAYAEAMESTYVRFFHRTQFIEFLRQHPLTALKLIEKLSSESKVFAERLLELSYGSSRARLARILLMIAQRHGKAEKNGLHMGLELTRQELGEFTGMSNETIIRTLSYFKKQGLVAIERHKIVLTDRERLRAFAEPFMVSPKENLL